MKLDLPHFENEHEEAKWWFEHQDEIAEQYLKEHPKDFVTPALPFVAVDFRGEDAQMLMERAAEAGVEPHTYTMRLVHDLLRRDKAA